MNTTTKQIAACFIGGAAALCLSVCTCTAATQAPSPATAPDALRTGALDALANIVLAEEDVDDALRNKAVALLGQYGGPAYSAVLLERLESGGSQADVIAAVRALVELGDDSIIPTLHGLFIAPETHRTRKDIRLSVSAAAGDALLKCGKTGTTIVLEATHGPDAEVRRRALQALARSGQHADTAFFITFTKDRDRWVRIEAAVILGARGDTAALPALTALLDDANSDVRLAAARSLARLGDPGGIKHLQHLARAKPDDGLAFRLLARLDPDQHMAALLTHLKHAVDDEELDEIAACLDPCERDKTVPPLVEACADDSTYLRANAAALLGRLKAHQAVGTLAGLIEDPSWEVRTQAASALGALGTKTALPPLRTLAKQLQYRGTDPQVHATREACALALARLGERETAARLCLVELSTRKRVIVSPEVAARVGGEALVRVLIESVQKPDPGAPLEQLLGELRALQLLHSKAAAPALEALLRERPYARMHAINLPEVWAALLEALGTCAGPDAARVAAHYADHETPLVRLAACHVILRLTTMDLTRD